MSLNIIREIVSIHEMSSTIGWALEICYELCAVLEVVALRSSWRCW